MIIKSWKERFIHSKLVQVGYTQNAILKNLYRLKRKYQILSLYKFSFPHYLNNLWVPIGMKSVHCDHESDVTNSSLLLTNLVPYSLLDLVFKWNSCISKFSGSEFGAKLCFLPLVPLIELLERKAKICIKFATKKW